MKKKLLAVVLGVSVALTLGACGNEEEKPSTKPGETASTDSGEKLYQKSCAGCHGNDLEGLNAPPLDTVGSKFDEKEIEQIIAKGRGAMPAGVLQGEDAKKVAEWLAEQK